MATTTVPGTDPEDNLWTDIGEDFLFSEDEALKNWLKGMTVSDDRNPARPVDVWFAMPDMEIREQKFPFIILELIALNEAKDREMRGLLKLTNDPGASVSYGQAHHVRMAETPLPFNLIYQAAAYSRHPRHHRQIIQQMLSSRVPGRLSSLYISDDNSRRFMELLSWTSRDTVEGGRKLWQTVFTISVTSEISDIVTTTVLQPVETSSITINTYDDTVPSP